MMTCNNSGFGFKFLRLCRYKDDKVIDYKRCIEIARLQLKVLDLLPENESTLFLSQENDTISFSGSIDYNFEERKSLLKVLSITSILILTTYCVNCRDAPLTQMSQDLVRLSVSTDRRCADPLLASRREKRQLF
jgi:hypothetical protein